MAVSTATIYKIIYAYLKGKEENIDKVLNGWEVVSPSKFEGALLETNLLNLAAALREDIAMAANKKAGAGNIEKAMKAIVKTAKKQTCNPAFHGFFLCDNNVTVCDGARIIRSFKTLEVAENNFVETLSLHESVLTHIKNARENKGEFLSLPTVGELKAFIKLKKAEQTKKDCVFYDFGEGLPMVNAEYLFDMLQGLTDAKAVCSEHSPVTNPVYFLGINGEGVLCPIRKG